MSGAADRSEQLTVGALVQARMSSERLPNKVLRPLAGRPALGWLLERLDHADELDRIVVATSTEASDDAVAAFCAEQGVDCHRGPLDDVAGRLIEAARRFDLDAFVRISGDSPLLDQRLVDLAVALLRKGDYDLVTNVAPRTFPAGQSVEVLRTDAFARVVGTLRAGDEREHVTVALYRRPRELRIHNFSTANQVGRTGGGMALDTEADARRLDALLSSLDRAHWRYGWQELVR